MGLNQVLVCRRYLGDQYLQGAFLSSNISAALCTALLWDSLTLSDAHFLLLSNARDCYNGFHRGLASKAKTVPSKLPNFWRSGDKILSGIRLRSGIDFSFLSLFQRHLTFLDILDVKIMCQDVVDSSDGNVSSHMHSRLLKHAEAVVLLSTLLFPILLSLQK